MKTQRELKKILHEARKTKEYKKEKKELSKNQYGDVVRNYDSK